LQAAVEAKDWDRAIQVVDRMIVLFPQQSAELAAYRSRLESLRGR
jgi:regulator of sirC expression with transglutaminase-like and TPR domain